MTARRVVEVTETLHRSGDETSLVMVEHVDCDGADVAILTLNRPEAKNPIDEPTIDAITTIIHDLVGGRETRALILTGAGDAFSSGGDLKKYQQMFQDAPRHARFVRAFGDACRLLEEAPILTVSMVNGTCVAGGTELALACDIVTIADEARIGDGHIRFGQSPGSGAQRLVRAIGLQRARHWLLSGELFPALVAVELGLAIACVPRADLRQYTLDLVGRMCQNSQLMVANMKRLIGIALNSHLDDGLKAEENLAIDYATTSYDAMEGLMAFAERRVPKFRGE
jgi:enoyl-CoA hydratase